MVIPTVRTKVNLTNLLSDSNVSLSDKDTGVMNRFGESKFENLGLESSFQKVFDFEAENVIEFHLVLFENSDTDQSSKKGVTFEKSFWVFFVQSKKGTGDLSDLSDSQFDSPDFTLVSECLF
jgi:hypothetical protein